MKDCPFCGRHDPVLFESDLAWWYECVRCVARGPRTFISPERAAELWNRRDES